MLVTAEQAPWDGAVAVAGPRGAPSSAWTSQHCGAQTAWGAQPPRPPSSLQGNFRCDVSRGDVCWGLGEPNWGPATANRGSGHLAQMFPGQPGGGGQFSPPTLPSLLLPQGEKC